jgi:anaerobic ribonucleoside-triphosphate reductase activating protein
LTKKEHKFYNKPLLPLLLLLDEERMGSTSKHILNIAASCVGTHALGPGLRSVVWVQGCPFRCAGCISPQWIPNKTNRLVPVEALAAELLSDPAISGFTFSGGEPFAQAAGLAALISLARQDRDLTLICFTGYYLHDLESMSGNAGIWDLLSQVDVLIDGPYDKDLNDNRGLRGSSNQKVHYLTGRMIDFDFETQPRNAEIHVRNGEMLFVGVPPQGLLSPVIQDVQAYKFRHKGVYERA